MSDLAGLLDIQLDARSGAVAIVSTRPLTAMRVFAGKTPQQVVRQLPSLFSLCGTAQAAAAVDACEQALGLRPSRGLQARRWVLVDAETIKEHLWRLLLDWPPMLEPLVAGERGAATPSVSQSAAAMPRVMRAFHQLRQAQRAAGDPFALDRAEAETGAAAPLDLGLLPALAVEQALGLAPAEWLVSVDDGTALQRWAEESRTPAAGLIRALMLEGLAACGANQVLPLSTEDWDPQSQIDSSAPASSEAQSHRNRAAMSTASETASGQRRQVVLEQLLPQLAAPDADAFIAAPRWQGRCAETGPLARVAWHPLIQALLAEHGNGLLTRIAALLVDLALSASRLETMIGCAATDARDRGQAVRADASQPGHWVDAGAADAAQGSRAADAIATRAGTGNRYAREQAPAGRAREVDDGSIEPSAAVGVDVRARSGQGMGAAEAARGLLVHRVSLADGRVERYQLLAPTEWNFHPQGVVAQGLSAIAHSGAAGLELERLARLYITAVDPCVEYRLSVS